MTKLAAAYVTNPNVKNDVDLWINGENKINANVGRAVKLKVADPSLAFSDDFHFDELAKATGVLEILGLSPWNDFHIFEAINDSNLTKCVYYYYSDEQCDKITELLPTLNSKGILELYPVKEFWRKMYEIENCD